LSFTLTKEVSSEAKNKTLLAIYSGYPKRANDIKEAKCWLWFFNKSRSNSVYTFCLDLNS